MTPSSSTLTAHMGTAADLATDPQLPAARGPLSAYVIARLDGRTPRSRASGWSGRALSDEDLQLALYLCYELHYGSGPRGSEELEWDLDLLRLRTELESSFEMALRHAVPAAPHDVDVGDLVAVLSDRVAGPSVSEFVLQRATVAQLREYVVHRSGYQLKEADPHTWVVPRLRGPAKQLLVEIQAGEYGADHADHRMHSDLFADTMEELGLDCRPNGHLDALPASSLAVSNLASMLGLHRRWRGAAMGHLALSELTSVAAMERYVSGLVRLQASPRARRFFEVHVLADAEHARTMIVLLDALVDTEPELYADVAFGIGASLVVESAFATQLLTAWERGASSLRTPI